MSIEDVHTQIWEAVACMGSDKSFDDRWTAAAEVLAEIRSEDTDDLSPRADEDIQQLLTAKLRKIIFHARTREPLDENMRRGVGRTLMLLLLVTTKKRIEMEQNPETWFDRFLKGQTN